MTYPKDQLLDSLRQGRRLSDIDNTEIKNVLTAFAALVGMPSTSLPTPEIMLVTIEAIKRNFGNMFEGEVRTAFEMASTGKLDAEDHYHSFSLKYICGVLNNYRIQVNKAVRFAESRRVEPQPSISNEEVDWQSTIDFLVDQVKEQDVRSLIIPVAIYDWLIKTNKVTLTIDQKLSWLKKAEIELEGDIFEKTVSRDVTGEERQWSELLKTSSYKKGDRLHNKLTIIAKRLVVRDYLIKKSREGINSRANNKSSHD